IRKSISYGVYCNILLYCHTISNTAWQTCHERADGDAGLSPPNERSGTQPTSPEKLRQLHTA
ncbi:hypothetical protein EDB81DRAFT_817912, partial [Dactylonectria macrodidyma]